MKIDKRIILYLDNQLNETEKREFENDLKNSPSLSLQLEKYKAALQGLEIDNLNLNEEEYFVNIIPKFREHLIKGKNKLKIKFSYSLAGVAAVVIVAVLLFNPFKKTSELTLDNLLLSFDDQEKIQLSNYYSIDLLSNEVEQTNAESITKILDMILTDFNLHESDISKIDAYGNMNTEVIFSELQQEEADQIYDEILKTKFF